MFVQEVALVSETTRVKTRELMRVGAALQKQAARDFEPIWSVPATIDVFERLEDVPIGYWPVIIRDDIGFQGAAGTHLDQDGQPFALVQADEPPCWRSPNSEPHFGPDALGARQLVDVSRRRHVFHGEAQGLEECRLALVRAPTERSREDRPDLSLHVVGSNRALALGED